MPNSKTKMFNWEKMAQLSDSEIEQKIHDILKEMSLREKAELMAGDKSLLSAIGMLIHYNKEPIPAGVNERLGIPGILFTDGPRGVVLNHSTCFPVSIARGASWDTDLEERIGNIIGIEAKAQGANFFGGICINLLRHPAWGRAQETYGEDPYLLGAFGSALVRGTQNHVMACAKHYACNSMENARFKVDVNVSERTLREIYLPHFKKCVDEGVASIMNAYNKVNGYYCGHNSHLLRDILKDDWGFKGFVITDFLLGIRDGKKAIKAGVDIEMPYHWRMKAKKIVKWVEKGEISEDLIDGSVLRILRQLIKFSSKHDSDLYDPDKVASQEHIDVALEAARKSIVLLKNDNNLLPINKETVNKIAIIGKLANKENIGDLGSSLVYPPYVVTPLQGLKSIANKDTEIVYYEGKSIKEAQNIAQDADYVILVVGFTEKEEGEYVFTKGGDRESLGLTHKDEVLILKIAEITDNFVVIMEGGSAIITETWREKVPAILMAWYPGMEGGTALAEIMFGMVNPSGKLPVVFPKSQDQLPYFNMDAESIKYGYYHGYRLLDKEKSSPAFPFGFGLSYTSYSYRNLTLSKQTIHEGESLQISIEISNEGDYDGEEIIQLYVGYENSQVKRPIKELKGFRRVAIPAGDSKTVKIDIDSNELAYYDDQENKWIIEKIEYIVYVGPSSSDNAKLLSKKFQIQ
ncbi:MAG: glycosyl hydrolase [Candidatus Lokiarchaeota archaeon]|nr:glycosyl hydrolase [Candidatus Lokiarchaeota archaeon]MBD3198485.1 glycosyl hydrolase [Candidatus Lokiarchaeota archaeon]